MKIPKKLRLFGNDWRVIIKKYKSGNEVNDFSFNTKTIRLGGIDKDEAFFHELLEAILLNNYNRYYGQEGSMEYVFFFNHTDLCKIVKKLTDSLKDNNLLK